MMRRADLQEVYFSLGLLFRFLKGKNLQSELWRDLSIALFLVHCFLRTHNSP